MAARQHFAVPLLSGLTITGDLVLGLLEQVISMLRSIFTILLVAFSVAAATERVHAQSAASEDLRLWDDANSRCRGGSGDSPKTAAACDERNRYAQRLGELGYCYGHVGDIPPEMYWHHCDARSRHAAGAMTADGQACVINDPTSTPLNYRTAPSGRIIGNIANGRRVKIIDQTTDVNGKSWVYISNDGDDRAPIGWVYRQYIDCF